MKTLTLLAVLTLSFSGVTAAESATDNALASMTILEIMETELTPATDVLWGAEESLNEDQWFVLGAAAERTLAIAHQLAKGGAGQLDNTWAKDPSWQAINNALIAATQQMIEAIKARNYDAFLDASDAIYPPCEACHKQFNPAVARQQ